MDRVHAYLESIEEINLAERRFARHGGDAMSRILLESALDAAKAAWLSVPADARNQMEPPPTRDDYRQAQP
jgi:hypothetical protein